MTVVRTFLDYTPLAREDGDPWTTVKFYEASDVDGQPGSFALIDTQAISPTDSNPAKPRSRNFTTEEATLSSGWYQLVFVDAASNTDVTDPVLYSAFLSPVAEATKSIMPMTWRALANATYYGEGMLLMRVDSALHQCFPHDVANADQGTYTPLMIEYAAKRSALEIIPAAIEYWMNQTNTISTSGTNEVVTYTDRANQLRQLAKWLQAEIARLAALPDLVTNFTPPGDQPEVADNTEDFVLTTSPYDFPPAFGDPTSSSSLFGDRD